MKGFEILGDFISIGIGMVGALLKGIKVKMHTMTIILSMLIAGIFSFSAIGIIETFFAHMSPKLIVLISFCVGWVANEITSKLDQFVNDFYEIIIDWIKSKFKIKKDENK